MGPLAPTSNAAFPIAISASPSCVPFYFWLVTCCVVLLATQTFLLDGYVDRQNDNKYSKSTHISREVKFKSDHSVYSSLTILSVEL